MYKETRFSGEVLYKKLIKLMAFQLITSVPTFTRLQEPRSCILSVGSLSISKSNSTGLCASPIQCMAATEVCDEAINDNRRSANYKPSIWSYDYLQSLSNEFEVLLNYYDIYC